MKKNYEPWTLDCPDFYKLPPGPQQLAFILRFAVLAPSSHNTQPWKFRLAGENIFVGTAPERRLHVSDSDDRQLFISLGAALENILVAADYYRWNAEIKYFPASEGNSTVAGISFSPTGPTRQAGDEEDEGHPIFAITRRHSNRNKYENRELEPKFAEWVLSLGNEGADVAIVTDKARRDAITDVILDATEKAMSGAGFREELSRYVKSNITSSPVGMPAFGMGIPTAPSLLAPWAVKYLNFGKLNRKKDEILLKQFTPAFVIISTREDDKENWLCVGRLYEKIALRGETLGIRTSVLAAALQIGGFHRKLQQILNTTFRPQILFRIGYCAKTTPHSPRLSAEEVMEKWPA